MPYEMIVTSTPRGLDGGSGFQAVQQTKGMSLALAERLQQRSGYTHQFAPGDGRNPVIYSHRIERVAGEVYHVIAAIRDAGTDHSGRSNRLAHLIAFSQAEIQDFPEGPAELLRHLRDSNLICKRWSGAPKQTASPALPKGNATPRSPCLAWVKAGVQPAIAGELAEAASGSGRVQILLGASVDALALFGDASLLVAPSNRWQITFSTDAAAAGQMTWAAVVGTHGQSGSESFGPDVIDATVKRQPKLTPFTQFAAGESRELPWQIDSSQPGRLAVGTTSAGSRGSPAFQPTASLHDVNESGPPLPPPPQPAPPPGIGHGKRQIASPRATGQREGNRIAGSRRPNSASKTAWLGVSILCVAAVGCVAVFAVGLRRPDLVFAALRGGNSTSNLQEASIEVITRRSELDIEKRKKPEAGASEKTTSSTTDSAAPSGMATDAARKASDEEAEMRERKKELEEERRVANLQSKVFDKIVSEVSLPRQSPIAINNKEPEPVTLGLLNLSGFKDTTGLLNVDLDSPPNIDLRVEQQPTTSETNNVGEKWCFTTSKPNGIGDDKRVTLLEMLIRTVGSELSEVSLRPSPRAFGSPEFSILEQCLIVLSPNPAKLSTLLESDGPVRKISLWKPSEAQDINVNPYDVLGEDNAGEHVFKLPCGNNGVNAIAGSLNIRLTVRVSADNDGSDKPRDIQIDLKHDLQPGERTGGEMRKRKIDLFDFGPDSEIRAKGFLSLEITDQQRLRYWMTLEPVPQGFWERVEDLRKFSIKDENRKQKFLEKKTQFLSSLLTLATPNLEPIEKKQMNLNRLNTLLDNIKKDTNLYFLDKAFGELADAAGKRIKEWEEDGKKGDKPQDYPTDFASWQQSADELARRINDVNDKTPSDIHLREWKRVVCRVAEELEKKGQQLVKQWWYQNAAKLARINRPITLTDIFVTTTYRSRQGQNITVELVGPSKLSDDGNAAAGGRPPERKGLSIN